MEDQVQPLDIDMNMQLNEFTIHSIELLGGFNTLAVFILAMIAVFYFILFINDYKEAKRYRKLVSLRKLIASCIAASLALLLYFVLKPYMEVEAEKAKQDFNAQIKELEEREITDEDYQYLVYSLLINDKSMIAKEQRVSIKSALNDGRISVNEFLQIPNTDAFISEKTIEMIKFTIKPENAKLVLSEMVRVES